MLSKIKSTVLGGIMADVAKELRLKRFRTKRRGTRYLKGWLLTTRGSVL